MKKEPFIKVVRTQKGWNVRLFKPNGDLHSEELAKTKNKIGPCCRYLLRWYDKCFGSYSKYADRARHRAWSKGDIATNEHDKQCRYQDMNWHQ